MTTHGGGGDGDPRPTGVNTERFVALVEPRPRGSIAIRLPFDPGVVWGEKDRHYVTGSIDGRVLRGALSATEGTYYLQLGPTWCRDPRVGPGHRVSVVLEPEGPQIGTIAADFAAALAAEPEARRFFESLATFYRNGYARWIEDAKRAETRAKRIEEALTALMAGRRERSSMSDRGRAP